MQEEVTDKSIAFVTNNTKMTTSVLKTVITAYLREKENQGNRAIASEAKKKQVVDDFVFYDASLKYLLAKLTSL